MSQVERAEILAAALVEAGIRCVFGIPGTQTVDHFEALRRARLRSVLATSELGAAFMAGGWARMTGEPGVILTIPGPGFTWALTGLAEAKLDSIPLLHLTVAPDRTPGHRFRQQELDQRAIAAPLVKAVIEPESAAAIPAAVADALRLCRTGEPGPVLLQLPPVDLAPSPPSPASPASPASFAPPLPDLAPLRGRLAVARRPVLFAGQGTLADPGALRALAEWLPAPVFTTPAARGVLPEDHPLALGFDGLAGDVEQLNALLDSCDLILVLGAKLGHNGTCGFALRLARERLVHVDASREVLGANYPASLEIVADAGETLRQLGHLLLPERALSEWTQAEVTAWRQRLSAPSTGAADPRVGGTSDRTPSAFFGALGAALPRQAVLVLDSGLHQILARRHFRVLEPRGLLFPSDLQSMGFAVPTAIGAAFADPSRPVVALVGDGGFAMTGMEILSAIREHQSLVVIVFVDGQLGQIRQQQLAEYGVGHAVELRNPDFATLAQALGAEYSDPGLDVHAAVEAAITRGGVTLIQVPVGDAPLQRVRAMTVRTKEAARRLAGPRLVHWVKQLLRRS